MKPSGTVWQPIVLLATLTLYLLAISGCNSKPTDPAPKDATDYIAYFADLNSDNWVFGYHILSGQLDSIAVPALPEFGMAISPDGNTLYLAIGDSTVVVDIESPQDFIVLNTGSQGGVSVSPDNRYLALLEPDGISILRTEDFAIVHQDTGHAYNGCFTASGNTFYCVVGDNTIYHVELGASIVATRKQRTSPWNATQIIPSSDESNWYVYAARSSCQWAIEVNDVAGDSILSRHLFEPGLGEMELAPNGSFLVYTNPDGIITYCYHGDASLTIYDPTTDISMQIMVVPDSADRDEYHDVSYFILEEVEVTPDSHWIVAGTGDVIAVVDATTFEVVKYEILPGRKRLAGLSIARNN